MNMMGNLVFLFYQNRTFVLEIMAKKLFFELLASVVFRKLSIFLPEYQNDSLNFHTQNFKSYLRTYVSTHRPNLHKCLSQKYSVIM